MTDSEQPQKNPILEAVELLTNVPKPLIDTAVEFLRALLGGPLKATGDTLEDQVRAWQAENRIRIALKTKKKLEKSGIPPEVLPTGFLLPLIEKSAVIDEPTLQEMWSNLLVSSIEDEKFQHPAFIKILSELSPKDARILNVVYVGVVTQHGGMTTRQNTVPLNHALEQRDRNDFVLNAHNLRRLDLVTLKDDKAGYPALTRFGRFFCEACIRDSEDPRALINQAEESRT